MPQIYRYSDSNYPFNYDLQDVPDLLEIEQAGTILKETFPVYTPLNTPDAFILASLIKSNNNNIDLALEKYRQFRILAGQYCIIDFWGGGQKNSGELSSAEKQELITGSYIQAYYDVPANYKIWEHKEQPKVFYDIRYPELRFYNYVEEMTNTGIWYNDSCQILKENYPNQSVHDEVIFCDMRANVYVHGGINNKDHIFDPESVKWIQFFYTYNPKKLTGAKITYYNGKGFNKKFDSEALKMYGTYKAYSGTTAPSSTAAKATQKTMEAQQAAQAIARQTAAYSTIKSTQDLFEPFTVLLENSRKLILFVLYSAIGLTGLYLVKKGI